MPGVFSQPPIRNLAGSTTDWPWQPLADCGAANPFFYHSFYDDMDSSVSVSGVYTKTTSGNGSVANAAGDGGLALFTTNSSTPLVGDIASIQLPSANFTNTAGKKLFFEARLQVSSFLNAAFLAGLIQTTTTPFTVTDGIYFSKATASAVVNINSAIGSTITTVAIPTAAFTGADATFFDIAFYVTRQGDILAYIDSQLVGNIPQSGTGATTPNAGVVARITAPSITTAVLNPTVALQSGTATSKTLTLDFVQVQKER